MTASFVAQSLLNGILIGGVYALVAVGLNLIFGVMRIINFAHGSLMMLGMFTTYWLVSLLQVDPYLSIFLVIPILFGVGVCFQQVVIHPIMRAPEHNQLLVTLGVSLFLDNLAVVLWSPDYRVMKTAYADINYYVGDVSVSLVRLLAFVLAVGCTASLYFLLKKTDLGKAIRAASEESEGAELTGINVKKVYLISFGIGSACAGVAGAAVAPFFPVYPYVGNLFTITAFVVIVLGGMGSFVGAFAGGVIIGVADSIGAMLLPAAMKSVISFSLFILILLFKPSGLFGGRIG
jgi:branched-chain amino acid transport system permease protein|uniref:Branched-chain amino acid ABC transporter permease n=1 Tax=Desulfomonile tiedjei TaxID=2358 RepID=A0A7C4AR67_9BACT